MSREYYNKLKIQIEKPEKTLKKKWKISTGTKKTKKKKELQNYTRKENLIEIHFTFFYKIEVRYTNS